MPERLDRIHFDVSGRQVEMPWKVGEELKARTMQAPSMDWLVKRMEAVGASRPIEIVNAADMLSLIELLEHWSRNADDALPESVRDLRGALRDALHNRRRAT